MRLWERPLFYYLRRLAPTEADTWDLLQETWLKVFRSIRSLRDPRSLPAFLYTTARHAAISRLRLKGGAADEPLAALDEAHNQNGAIIALENAEQVHHALDQLPLLQREAMTLYFLQDLSIEEIGQVLDVPVGTVKSRLHYGKQAIREIISKGDSDAG